MKQGLDAVAQHLTDEDVIRLLKFFVAHAQQGANTRTVDVSRKFLAYYDEFNIEVRPLDADGFAVSVKYDGSKS